MKPQNLTICGRRTSVRLEKDFWSALDYIARKRKTTIDKVAEMVYLKGKRHFNLSSSLRTYSLKYFKSRR